MSKARLNGTELEYLERGSGSPVVFVHGSVSDYRTWEGQVREFGGRFRAVAYSRRYHWPNERITEGADYEMVQHVDDLHALLGRLDATPAHLVGHSYGAFVCLLLAARKAELVRTLVLAEHRWYGCLSVTHRDRANCYDCWLPDHERWPRFSALPCEA